MCRILENVLDDFFIDTSSIKELKNEIEIAINRDESILYKSNGNSSAFGLFCILDVVTNELNSLKTMVNKQEYIDTFKALIKLYYGSKEKLTKLQWSIKNILSRYSNCPQNLDFYSLTKFNLALIKVLKQDKTLLNKKRPEFQHSQAFL